MITTTKQLALALACTLHLLPAPATAQDEDFEPDYDMLPGVLGKTGFAVENFIPNRVKVEATADDKRYGTSTPLTVNVSAEEMFGQPVANKPVSGSVTWSPTPFAPPPMERLHLRRYRTQVRRQLTAPAR